MRLPDSDKSAWFALAVAPRHERTVERGLTRLGVEAFVPWHRVRRRWSDRIKELELNLFPGYVFCRLGSGGKLVVARQPGIYGIVGAGASAAVIPDADIQAVRSVIASGLPLGPWPYLREGQRVRIRHGSLAGIEGTLAQIRDRCRVVIHVDILCRAVAVEIDRDMLCPAA